MNCTTTDFQRRVILCLLLCGIFTLIGACQHRKSGSIGRPENLVELDDGTKRGIQMQRQADVLICYDGPDEIVVSVDYPEWVAHASEKTLKQAIDSAKVRRGLAVVIFGKRDRMELPEPEMGKKADWIKGQLKSQGFNRVIFQLASASGIPVYRE